MSVKHLRFLILLVIIILLVFLNIQKYGQQNEELLVSVWSSYDSNYYNHNINMNLLDRIKETFHPERLIYGVSKIRLRAPITYLKREIPLLAYYIPEELQSPGETIYIPDFADTDLIELNFDLRDEGNENNENILTEKIPIEEELIEIPEIEEEKRVPEKQPVIAIYHSHTAETYIDDPRNQDANGRVLPGNVGNVGKVGMELSRILSEKYGFKVIHTTEVHDQVYNRSYYNSRNTVRNLLEKNPDIDLILDIHRDSIRNYIEGTYTTIINQLRVARIMIVVTNEAFSFEKLDADLSFERSNWQQNLALANSMADRMEEMYPGLLQRITIRDTTANRYNQDLHPHSLLLEIGDYNNTTEEAIRSARYLAEVIASMF